MPSELTRELKVEEINPSVSGGIDVRGSGGQLSDRLEWVQVILRKCSSTLIDLQGVGLSVGAVEYEGFSLGALREQPPALIILDVSLPIQAAREICDLIKSDEIGRGIPILMLLNRPTHYCRPETPSFRPDHFLLESFTLSQLLAAIDLLLNPTQASAAPVLGARSSPPLYWMDPFS